MDASVQTEAEQAKILEILYQFQAEVTKRFDALEAKMQTEIQAFQKSVSEDLAAVKGDLDTVKGDLAAVKGDLAAVKEDSLAMMIKLSNFQANFEERLQSVEQDVVQLQQPESSESKRGAGHARSEAADMGQ